MSYIEKKNFRKTTRYIYNVDYRKKENENYEIITKVHYFRWDEEEGKFNKYYWDRNSFAKALYEGSFSCYAGKDTEEKLIEVVEVIAYEQNNEYWIKTKQNETIKDNFSFLEYAKNHGFAKLVK